MNGDGSVEDKLADSEQIEGQRLALDLLPTDSPSLFSPISKYNLFHRSVDLLVTEKRSCSSPHSISWSSMSRYWCPTYGSCCLRQKQIVLVIEVKGRQKVMYLIRYEIIQGAQMWWCVLSLNSRKFIGKKYTHLRHEGTQGAQNNAYRPLFFVAHRSCIMICLHLYCASLVGGITSFSKVIKFQY